MSAKAKSFADRATPPRPHVCPRCREGDSTFAVAVNARKLKTNRTAGRMAVARQVSVCEPCAVEIYDACEALIVSAKSGASS